MKSLILSVICGLAMGAVYAQKADTVTVYYDSTWTLCAKDTAIYYRKSWKTDKHYVVRDYFLSGELQMTGWFLDSKWNKYDGKFVYYLQNGQVSAEKEWEKNTEVGHWKMYYDNGHLKEEDWYGTRDQKQWKVVHYREATGEKYSEGEKYMGENHGWWTFYYPGGGMSAKEYWEKGGMKSYKLYDRDGLPQVNDNYESTKLPKFKGHSGGAYGYIGTHLSYPQEAKTKSIEGTVKIQLSISETGEVLNVKVLQSVHPTLDMEALRVVKQMKEWTPGVRHNQIAEMKINIPIVFKLR